MINKKNKNHRYMGIGLSNSGKQAPRWFRITKKVLSNTENLVIAILLLKGYTAESPTMLIYKLCSSFVMNNLDTILAESTEPTIDGVPPPSGN